MSVGSDQIQFWRGAFGDEYTARNAPEAAQIRARTVLWGKILERISAAPPRSILEIGANIGLNLRALRALTDAKLFALEPNHTARERLVADGVVPADAVLDGMAESIPLPDAATDLAFTSGVLIHIHPDNLMAACREIHRVSARYLACIEYFSTQPSEVSYRGHQNVLFKRDFGGFWMDGFRDLHLVDYGFAWRRATGLDDLTWWLFEKRG